MATKKKKQQAEAEAPAKKAKKSGRRAMKDVVAVSKGYYGLRIRNPGDTFRIPEDEELGSWMALAGDYEEEEPTEGASEEEDSSGDEEVL